MQNNIVCENMFNEHKSVKDVVILLNLCSVKIQTSNLFVCYSERKSQGFSI
jgi:hypothetical protein